MGNVSKFKNKYRTTSHRLEGYDYSSDGAYFVTICTKDREHLFGKIVSGRMVLNRSGEIAQDEWEKTGCIRENVTVDEFVIMPNHMHGVLVIQNNDGNAETPRRGVSTKRNPNHKPEWKRGCLGAIVNQFKSICTKKIRISFPDFSWQSNYYDHIIRNEEELNRIREYIQMNPERWDEDRNNLKGG